MEAHYVQWFREKKAYIKPQLPLFQFPASVTQKHPGYAVVNGLPGTDFWCNRKQSTMPGSQARWSHRRASLTTRKLDDDVEDVFKNK